MLDVPTLNLTLRLPTSVTPETSFTAPTPYRDLNSCSFAQGMSYTRLSCVPLVPVALWWSVGPLRVEGGNVFRTGLKASAQRCGLLEDSGVAF
jgi:hypothetical protein